MAAKFTYVVASQVHERSVTVTESAVFVLGQTLR